MKDILNQIAEYARTRVAEAKRKMPLEQLREQALGMELNTGFPFERALSSGELGFICEC